MSGQGPDYEALANLLADYGDGIDASECHGILCGMLTMQSDMDGATWARQMLSGELEAGPGGAQAGTLNDADLEMVRALFVDTLQQLDDPELGFQPLLPGDDESLAIRTEALGAWCDGYLYGLSISGLTDFDKCPEQVQEFLRDLVQIAQLETDPDEEESNENALFDVIEYVRMGVLMVRDELSPPARPTIPIRVEQGPGPDDTLH